MYPNLDDEKDGKYYSPPAANDQGPCVVQFCP